MKNSIAPNMQVSDRLWFGSRNSDPPPGRRWIWYDAWHSG